MNSKEPSSSSSLLRSHPLQDEEEEERQLRSFPIVASDADLESEKSFERLTLSMDSMKSPGDQKTEEQAHQNNRTADNRFLESGNAEFLNLVYGSSMEKTGAGIGLTLNGLHVNLEDDADDYYDEESQCLNPDNKKKRSNSNRSKKSLIKGPSLFIKSYDEDIESSSSVTPTPSQLEEDVSGSDSGQPSVETETSLSIFLQVFFPFLIGGFGTVGAGLVLDYVQHWEVFKKVTQVFILVPALLGLKGNLEMTLASRLSTAANLGLLDSFDNQWKMSVGNIALVQSQAAVVGFLAASFAILMDWLPEGNLDWSHATLLVASSLLTASIASFLLAILMIIVVIVSHKCNINPDNVATPIAASLGDLTTLTLLANISSLLYYTLDKSLWLCLMLIIVFVALIPLFTFIAHSNPFTRDVLYYGWSPVISAMAISSVGGIILDFAVSRFSGIAVFQPVINGVGGNLVAVQASRISTYLHQRSCLGSHPRERSTRIVLFMCLSPSNLPWKPYSRQDCSSLALDFNPRPLDVYIWHSFDSSRTYDNHSCLPYRLFVFSYDSNHTVADDGKILNPSDVETKD